MLPNLTVRPGEATDADALDHLMDAIGPVCLWSMGHCGVVVEQTLLVLQGDALIGFVAWAQDEMQAVLVGFGVREDRRRFGVGTWLLQMAVAHLRDAGLRLIEASAQSGVAAVFEGAGFRQIDVDTCGRVFFQCRLWGRRNRGDGFA